MRRAEKEPLSQQEVRRMVEGARTTLERLLIWLLWVTGGRISEVLQVRPMDLDFGRRRVRLPTLKRKDPDAWRFCVLWDNEGLEEVRDYCEGMPPRQHLFPWSRQEAYYRVRMVGKKAGIPRVHPHLMRHSLAAHWIGNGGSIPLVARQLGHQNISTTFHRYGRYVSEDVLEEAQRVMGGQRE